MVRFLGGRELIFGLKWLSLGLKRLIKGFCGLILGLRELIVDLKGLILGLRGLSFGYERAELRPKRGLGGTDVGIDVQTDVQTDIRKFTPVSHRTSALWGCCPKVKCD